MQLEEHLQVIGQAGHQRRVEHDDGVALDEFGPARIAQIGNIDRSNQAIAEVAAADGFIFGRGRDQERDLACKRGHLRRARVRGCGAQCE